MENVIKAEKIDTEKKIEFKATASVDFTKVFNSITVHPDSLILDVATGVGTIPHLLGSHVVALDISNKILKDAKKICQAIWVCGDARVMPFRKDAFDLVTIFAGLMFIPGKQNKAKTLVECFRVLKSEGKIVLVEPNIQNPQLDLPIRFNIWWKGKRIGDVGVGTKGEGLKQSAKSLKEMIQNIGFSIIRENLSSEYFELICQK